MVKKRFKELSDRDVEYIKVIYYSQITHDEKIDILTKRFGIVGRTVRSWWTKLDLSGANLYGIPKQLLEAREREIDEDTDIVLVTAAQNKTVINSGMLESMEMYKTFIFENFGLKCQIIVIPARYRNPTSPIESNKKRGKVDEWWDNSIDKYLYYNKLYFGDALISADSRVVPTASMPLNGYETMAGGNHFILGHPRIHLKTIPRFKGDKLRVMCTTGFLSMKNYSRSKAGDRGFVHHSYGFTIIEKKKDGTCYAPRPVKVNSDGTFTDYKYEVSKKGVGVVTSSMGYIWGDIHHRELDGRKYQASMELLGELNPDVNVFHDLYDGSTVNPHEKDDLFIRKLKISQGIHLVEEEVENSIKFLEQFRMDYGGDVYVVQSNHDDFLDRYVNKFNWKTDLHNSGAYLKYAAIQQSEDLRDHGNIYGFLINDKFKGDVIYLKNTDSLKINTYQCGHHGDYGVNGARGNIMSFKRLNTKMIHGHGHSPTMMDGVTMVGVSCNLWQYYNSSGLSGWALSDSVVHKSGKNQLIIFDESDYKFTMLK